MTTPFDPDALALACASLPEPLDLAPGSLEVLRRKGTSNDHVRLGDSGLVARVPRFSHSGFDASTNLARQKAAFERAVPSGHTPALHAVLPIGPGLPGGALIVTFIEGRTPRLPDDMPALADALGALHKLPVPPPAQRPPLGASADPLTETRTAIERHASCLDAFDLDAGVCTALEAELAWAREFDGTGLPDLPPRFVAADTHPGNFLIDATGHAWLTDLERAQYGPVPVDLAHASLPTSTGWDPDVAGDLTNIDVVAFYARYRQQTAATVAAEIGPWLRPLRRLTWLRTMTFFARWQTDWSRDPAAGTRDPAMDRHIAGHIARCFTAEMIAATRLEWLGPDPLILNT